MSAAETPRFSIPYPADDAEGWWNVFRDGMNAIDTILFKEMEANKLIMQELPQVVVEVDGLGGYQLRFVSGDLTFVSRTLETYIPVDVTTPVPLYQNGLLVCPIPAGATSPDEVEIECLLNGVEIDSSLVVIGYVRSDYTVIWFNGVQLAPNNTETMFSGTSGGGGALPTLTGAGNPNGVASGAASQLYWDTTNYILYVNHDSATGWYVV